jgi:alpha-1,2-glucosyltransferase
MKNSVRIFFRNKIFFFNDVDFLQYFVDILSQKIDEIFHVPAAGRYCAGNYSYWDPKITTPPGLYIYSNLIKMFIEFISERVKIGEDGDVECDVTFLRLTNVLFVPFLYIILNPLYAHMYGDKSVGLGGWSLTIVSFPLFIFFSLFYYTDCGSLVILTLLLFTLFKKRLFNAAILTLIALIWRQTNIVWIFFSTTVALLYANQTISQK